MRPRQTIVVPRQTRRRRPKTLQTAGSKRTRSMDVPAGGHVPLPYRNTRVVARGRGSVSALRRRGINMVADAVAMSALKPYAPGANAKNCARIAYHLIFFTLDMSKDSSKSIVSCIELVSVTAYRTTDRQNARSNLQRCLLFADASAHREIWSIAVGIIPQAVTTNDENTAPKLVYHRMLTAQLHALDILGWLLAHWRLTRDR